MEANIKKVVYHTTPCFTSFYLTFVNSESFFKTSGRPNILILTTFAGYRISTFALQNSLKFIFPLGSKASKLSRNYQKILTHFKISISFYYAAFFCLIVLGKNDVEKFLLNSYLGKMMLKKLLLNSYFFCM